ncbi:MAG TPA: aldo/keto reductase [Magnetospirillaceae bacterium]|jgi:diketogulonate reductase-like aldo/keto reductase
MKKQGGEAPAMRFITLNGTRIPALGLGTYPMSGQTAQRAITTAIGIGYRHIDTAQMYGNEADVGAAIKESGIDRGQIFVTTKLDNGNHAAAEVKYSTEQSLRKLATDYVDLLLIHWPVRDVPLAETLDAMAKLKAAGKVRHIGVSNFNTTLMDDAVALQGDAIVCNQVEYHVFLSQKAVVAAARKHKMMVTAYCPVAHGDVAKDATVIAIAKRLNKTPTQVALRWLVEQDPVAAIPKASSRAHLEENFSIFDFELSPADRAAIDKLGSPRGRIINWPGVAPVWDRD